jgi:membrane protease YdiL (CAAX protease family)
VSRDTTVVRRLGATIDRRPVAAFFLLTFGWTWGCDLLLYAAVGPSPSITIPPTTAPRTWGPLVATALVLGARGESVRGFLRDVITLPSRRWVLPVAFLVPVAFAEYHTLLAVLTGRPVEGLAYPAWAYPASFLFVFLFAGALEEFGWRAFAQPELQTRYPAAVVALGIGTAWATWHLPLFLLFDIGAYDPATLPAYYLALMFDSVILAWLFDGSGGSVLAPMTFHAAGNMPAVAAVSGPFPGVLGLLDEHGYVVSVAVLAAVLVVVKGAGLVAGTRPVPYRT